MDSPLLIAILRLYFIMIYLMESIISVLKKRATKDIIFQEYLLLFFLFTYNFTHFRVHTSLYFYKNTSLKTSSSTLSPS